MLIKSDSKTPSVFRHPSYMSLVIFEAYYNLVVVLIRIFLHSRAVLSTGDAKIKANSKLKLHSKVLW